MIAFERMHWLDVRAHATLLMHAVCGDWLSPPDHQGTWFSPAGVSRGDRLTLLSYEAATTIGLCAVLPRDMSADWIAALRDRLSPQKSEGRWAHFVGQLGPYQRMSAETPPVWLEVNLQCDGKRWGVRRARHPSTLVDILLTRERAEAEAQVLAAFANQANPPGDLMAGEVQHSRAR